MIRILCVGKIKENYLKDLISDYELRISKYHKIEIVEVKDNDDRRTSIIEKLNEDVDKEKMEPLAEKLDVNELENIITYNKSILFMKKAEDLKGIPGLPIAYWVNEKLINIFKIWNHF